MRKIIQIATTTAGDDSGLVYNLTIVACDDGTIWGMHDLMFENPRWFQLPDIPQDEIILCERCKDFEKVFPKLPDDLPGHPHRVVPTISGGTELLSTDKEFKCNCEEFNKNNSVKASCNFCNLDASSQNK